jgi:DNA-binding SARP family transcriptional activator
MRSYTRCVQTLRTDLGIEPLPETITLYEKIKRNEAI